MHNSDQENQDDTQPMDYQLSIHCPMLFIESASLHGAFAALILGDSADWTKWDTQSLLDCTYLLLFQNARIVPGPNRPKPQPAKGYEQDLVRFVPEILHRTGVTTIADQNTIEWLKKDDAPLKEAWLKLCNDPNERRWSDIRRELFWVLHQEGNGSLFQIRYIPWLADALDVSERDLRRVQSYSTDKNQVKRWAMGKMDEAARIADRAYLCESLIRGKFHDFAARESAWQLLQHPHRLVLPTEIENMSYLPATDSEEFYCKIVIGSALKERTGRERINRWGDNIASTRRAIENMEVNLDQCSDQRQAENKANQAAKKLGIPVARSTSIRTLDWGITSLFGVSINLLFGPWLGLASTLIPEAYRKLRERSVAEELANLSTSKVNFGRLARSVPGRVSRPPS